VTPVRRGPSPAPKNSVKRSLRRNLLIGPGSFLLVAVLAWALVLEDKRLRLLHERGREPNLIAAHAAAQRNRKELPDLIARRARLDRELEQVLPQAFEAGTADLLRGIARASHARGLDIDRIRPLPAQVHPTHAEVTVALRVSGAYHDLVAFLEDLSGLARNLTLHNMVMVLQDRQVAAHASAAAPARALVLEATLRAYRAPSPQEEARAVQAAAHGGTRGAAAPAAVAAWAGRSSAVAEVIEATPAFARTRANDPFDLARLDSHRAPRVEVPLQGPHPGRPWLEQHAMSEMEMVGVIGQADQRLALVRLAGAVHVVRAGQGMGLHGGRITQITAQGLTVDEPVARMQGPGRRHSSTLTLQEARP